VLDVLVTVRRLAPPGHSSLGASPRPQALELPPLPLIVLMGHPPPPHPGAALPPRTGCGACIGLAGVGDHNPLLMILRPRLSPSTRRRSSLWRVALDLAPMQRTQITSDMLHKCDLHICNRCCITYLISTQSGCAGRMRSFVRNGTS
jgi:hypothetical protein